VGVKPTAASSGTIALGDLSVARLGYGAAKLTGPGIWGPPADVAGSVELLRLAVDLGVNLIDTADSYGPFVSEDLIRRALHPYRDVVIATKGGCLRTGPDQWSNLATPEYLRQCCEMSLRRLGLEAIDLYQLHEVDPLVAFEDQLGALVELQAEGKIRHIGLSSVRPEQLELALSLAQVVSVQGWYNLLERSSEEILRRCEAGEIAFLPFFPLADGVLGAPSGPLRDLAATAGCSPAQLAIAWLLHRSEVMLPIPGTASVAELEENVAAAGVALSGVILRQLDDLTQSVDVL
jgi:aryl-alcohol dehydrogenase-like predicted oxidoreductase